MSELAGRFWLDYPLLKAVKAGDGRFYLEGVASDQRLDLEHESTLASAWEEGLEYLKSQGKLNWNHNPNIILGEIVEAKRVTPEWALEHLGVETVGDAIYTKAFLYEPNDEMSEETRAKLQMVRGLLAADGRIGLSIEGARVRSMGQMIQGVPALKTTRAIPCALAATTHPINSGGIGRQALMAKSLSELLDGEGEEAEGFLGVFVCKGVEEPATVALAPVEVQVTVQGEASEEQLAAAVRKSVARSMPGYERAALQARAFAKSLADLLRIAKGRVKGYYRTDPRSGKRVFVPEHDAGQMNLFGGDEKPAPVAAPKPAPVPMDAARSWPGVGSGSDKLARRLWEDVVEGRAVKTGYATVDRQGAWVEVKVPEADHPIWIRLEAAEQYVPDGAPSPAAPAEKKPEVPNGAPREFPVLMGSGKAQSNLRVGDRDYEQIVGGHAQKTGKVYDHNMIRWHEVTWDDGKRGAWVPEKYADKYVTQQAVGKADRKKRTFTDRQSGNYREPTADERYENAKRHFVVDRSRSMGARDPFISTHHVARHPDGGWAAYETNADGYVQQLHPKTSPTYEDAEQDMIDQVKRVGWDIQKINLRKGTSAVTKSFQDAFPTHLPDHPCRPGELERLLRQDIAAEQEAIAIYEVHADAAEDELVARALRSIADEECVHVGELQALLNRLTGGVEAEKQAEGEAEVAKLDEPPAPAPGAIAKALAAILRIAKGRVKGYIKTDSRTGKRVRVPDYDTKRQAAAGQQSMFGDAAGQAPAQAAPQPVAAQQAGAQRTTGDAAEATGQAQVGPAAAPQDPSQPPALRLGRFSKTELEDPTSGRWFSPQQYATMAEGVRADVQKMADTLRTLSDEHRALPGAKLLLADFENAVRRAAAMKQTHEAWRAKHDPVDPEEFAEKVAEVAKQEAPAVTEQAKPAAETPAEGAEQAPEPEVPAEAPAPDAQTAQDEGEASDGGKDAPQDEEPAPDPASAPEAAPEPEGEPEHTGALPPDWKPPTPKYSEHGKLDAETFKRLEKQYMQTGFAARDALKTGKLNGRSIGEHERTYFKEQLLNNARKLDDLREQWDHQGSAEAQQDAQYHVGTRVKLRDGRHGTVKTVKRWTMSSAFGGETTAHHQYDVRTDGGAVEHRADSDLTPLAPGEKSPEVSKDPLINGSHRHAADLVGDVARLKAYADGEAKRAERARTRDSQLKHAAAARDYQAKYEALKSHWDQWAGANPEEAKRVQGERDASGRQEIHPHEADLERDRRLRAGSRASAQSMVERDVTKLNEQPPVQGLSTAYNAEHQGIEIRFTSKPSEATLTHLKGAGYRWSSRQKLWYAKAGSKALDAAHWVRNTMGEGSGVSKSIEAGSGVDAAQFTGGRALQAERGGRPHPEPCRCKKCRRWHKQFAGHGAR